MMIMKIGWSKWTMIIIWQRWVVICAWYLSYMYAQWWGITTWKNEQTVYEHTLFNIRRFCGHKQTFMNSLEVLTVHDEAWRYEDWLEEDMSRPLDDKQPVKKTIMMMTSLIVVWQSGLWRPLCLTDWIWYVWQWYL